MKEKEVFEKIEDVKKHPVYIEAIHIAWRWFANTVAVIVLLMTLLLTMCHYEYMSLGEECIKRCQIENLSDNCQDYCF